MTDDCPKGRDCLYSAKLYELAEEILRLRTENEKLRANFTMLADAVRAAKEAASYNRHKSEHCISRSMWSALSDQEKYARKALSETAAAAALKETGDE